MKTGKVIVNKLVLFTLVTFVFLFIIAIYKPLYQYNDDVLMQDFLSGSFTGNPTSMLVFIKNPLTIILYGLTLLFPQVSWLGVFELGLCLGSSFFILDEGADLIKGRSNKIYYLLIVGGILSCFVLRMVSAPNFTYISEMAGLGAVLCMYFYRIRQAQFKKYVLFFLMFMLFCYNIREEVFLMLCPFLIMVVAFHVSDRIYMMGGRVWKNVFFFLGNWKRYSKVVLLFIVSFILVTEMDFFANRTKEWENYLEYNDIRSEVYDYMDISTSEEALKYYQKQGISKEDAMFYHNYNIMLTKESEYEDLEAIYDYQTRKNKTFGEVAGSYVYSIFQNGFPLNFIVLSLYVVLVSVYLQKGHREGLITLALLFVMRSGLWCYLIFKGRYPMRVTTGLWLFEGFVILGEIMCLSLKEREPGDKSRKAGNVSLDSPFIRKISLGVLVVLIFVNGYDTTLTYQSAVKRHDKYSSLFQYMEKNPDKFYLLDLYSFMDYTEYVFEKDVNRYDNYLLMGGWLTNNPLTEDKLEKEGYESVRDALECGENVYIITQRDIELPELSGKEYRKVKFIGDFWIIKVSDNAI